MATIRKRNQKYQVQVRRTGAATLTRTFTKKPDALKWAIEQEHLIETVGVGSYDRKQAHTVASMLDRYESEILPLKRAPEQERYILRALRRSFLGPKNLRQVTAEDFVRFRDQRLREVKPSTLQRQFNVLKHALRVAKDLWGWTTPLEALKRIPMPAQEPYSVSRIPETSIGQLLEAVEKQRNPHVALAVRIAVGTGLRRGEVLRLEWDDLSDGATTIRVRTSKNGHARIIPLGPAIADLLLSVERSTQRVVPITANCLKLAFQRARKTSGVTFRFHDLRHEAISRLFEAGLTVPEAQLISGHRTLSQLSRYAHADIDRIAEKLHR